MTSQSWLRQTSSGVRGSFVALGLASAIVIAWTVVLGRSVSKGPQRCPSDFSTQGARCCARGQTVGSGRCLGPPEQCPHGRRPTSRGCSIEPRRVLVAAGRVTLGPTDWDSAELIQHRTLEVAAFYMDHVEVTHERYAPCAVARMCRSLPAESEPALPVTGISVDDAAVFCAYAGGRLPTSAEWIFAAAGPEARRYPWGAHGLVCRRASFGLSSGPCAHQGITPDWPGSRPEGQSPEGIFDLAGNVAEWTVDVGGQASVRGGSFRSKTPAELKTWASAPPREADDVGFRCVYDRP